MVLLDFILVTFVVGASGLLLVKDQAETDAYSVHDGKHHLLLTACTENVASALIEATKGRTCTRLSDSGLDAQRGQACATEEVFCLPSVGHSLLAQFSEHVELISRDAGGHFREQSGNVKPMTDDEWQAKDVDQEDAALADGPGSESILQKDSSEFYTWWRPYSDKIRRVRTAVENSNGAATRSSVGKSLEGRPIEVVRIKGKDYQEGDPKILMNFQVHAREWLAGMAGTYITERMIKKAKDTKGKWPGKIEVVLVPQTNPDGIVFSEVKDRMWRKNRRILEYTGEGEKDPGCDGVDLNRNWPKDWNGTEAISTDMCDEAYKGSKPFSEPEAQALAKLIEEAGLVVHLDFHAYGELIAGPWSYKKEPHPDKAAITALGNRMKKAMEESGAAGELSNKWKAEVTPEDLYLASGVLPDYSTDLGAWGYTVEMAPLGDQWKIGFAPARDTIMGAVKDMFAGSLAAVESARAMTAQAQMKPAGKKSKFDN